MLLQNYYEKKYNKYKNKYLELKEQLGGNKSTANTVFYNFICDKTKYKTIYNIFTKDDILKKELLNNHISRIPLFDDLDAISFEQEKIKEYQIFQDIFEYIFKKLDNKTYIDLFIKIYLNGELGPSLPGELGPSKTVTYNGLEDISKFKEHIDKVIMLNKNGQNDERVYNFNSLNELEEYILKNKKAIDEIENKKEIMKKKEGA